MEMGKTQLLRKNDLIFQPTWTYFILFQAQKNMVNNYDRTNGRVMNTLITKKLPQSIHITSTVQAHNTKVK